MSNETEPASEPKVPDPIEALRALSVCLRHLSCGYGLDPRERDACLTLLAAGIPGVDTADLQTAEKLLQVPRRLGRRQRDRAAELSVRFADGPAGVDRAHGTLGRMRR